MYSLELSLRYSPFPISIQKKEFDDVKRIYDDIKNSMDETSETSDVGYQKAGTRTSMVTKSDRNMTSDSTLTILSNKNNPIVEVRFRDMFPTSLSALNYDQSATDVDYMKANATFEYQLYEIIKL